MDLAIFSTRRFVKNGFNAVASETAVVCLFGGSDWGCCMRLLSPSVVLLFVLSFPITQAQVSMTSPRGPQTPVITVTLGPDQTGLVKTAQGITTRIAFPEKVTESICGDLYDAASGRGTFVVQISGSDVFLKPVSTKGMSNLFVMTGEGANRQIYHFDLNVVGVAQAHRVVNVIAAAPERRPAPAAAESMASEAPCDSGGLSLKQPPTQIRTASSNPPVFTTSDVRNVEFDPAGEAPGGTIPAAIPPEPPPPVKVPPGTTKAPKLEPPKSEQPKREAPRIIRKSGGVISGDAIIRAEPAYPPRAKEARVSGTVIVEVTVDESGKVIAARAVSGHPLLSDAAVIAARGWRFNPTKVSGQPVRVVRTITFNFNL